MAALQIHDLPRASAALSSGWPSASLLGAPAPRESADLLSRGTGRRFNRNAILVEQDEHPNRVVVLLEGQCKVAHLMEDGREVILARVSAGDLVGECAAIDGGTYSATVTALGPVRAVVLRPSMFVDLLEQRPQLLRSVTASLARRLREADQKTVEYGILDAEGRVISRLVELATAHDAGAGDPAAISLPISQTELAAWTGTSRSAVAGVLRNLRRRGWVETSRRSITIVDAVALRARARLAAA